MARAREGWNPGSKTRMSEHWRDLHRHVNGHFKARPGAKGFKPVVERPPPEAEKPGRGFRLFVDKNKSEAKR
jgi:hypothetical protein